MPRNPNNNPTDRILRLLAEYDSVRELYERQTELIAQHVPPAALGDWPPPPSFKELDLEIQRQGGDYRRLRPAITAARDQMRRQRARGGTRRDLAAQHDASVQAIIDAVESPADLSADEIARRLKASRDIL